MSEQKKHISDVREALFKVLDGLTDPEKPMDIERARAINETAQTIINSAKVEVDFLKVMHGDGDAPFLASPELPAPVKPQTPLPSADQVEDADTRSREPGQNYPWRTTVHKLRG